MTECDIQVDFSLQTATQTKLELFASLNEYNCVQAPPFLLGSPTYCSYGDSSTQGQCPVEHSAACPGVYNVWTYVYTIATATHCCVTCAGGDGTSPKGSTAPRVSVLPQPPRPALISKVPPFCSTNPPATHYHHRQQIVAQTAGWAEKQGTATGKSKKQLEREEKELRHSTTISDSTPPLQLTDFAVHTHTQDGGRDFRDGSTVVDD